MRNVLRSTADMLYDQIWMMHPNTEAKFTSEKSLELWKLKRKLVIFSRKGFCYKF